MDLEDDDDNEDAALQHLKRQANVSQAKQGRALLKAAMGA